MNQQTTDGARARQRAAGRHFLLTLAGALGLLACAAAPASAANLILDTGAEVTLSGEHVYDIVNVDNNARIELAADAVIRAKQVYIGPTAVLATCWIPGGNGNQDNGCVNGRSLAIVSEGPLVVARGISLQGGTGAARNGGSLTLYGSSVVVGGPITTVGIATAPNIASSGNVEIRSAGSVVTEAINAAGASVTIAGGSILVGGGIDVDPDTNGVNPISPPGAYGSSNARGGAVAVDSTGDVRSAARSSRRASTASPGTRSAAPRAPSRSRAPTSRSATSPCGRAPAPACPPARPGRSWRGRPARS